MSSKLTLIEGGCHCGHLEAVRKRGEWFEPGDRAPFVLWWVRAGHIPDVAEAKERLEHLWEFGHTARAFTFRRRFAPRDGTDAP